MVRRLLGLKVAHQTSNVPVPVSFSEDEETVMTRAVTLLGDMRVPAEKFDEPWQTLSGGEGQRCYLAVVLATR